MPHKDLEVRRAYNKAYREKKKAELAAKQKAKRAARSDEEKAKDSAKKKEYRAANRDKLSAKQKEYHATYIMPPKSKKTRFLRIWKGWGVLSDDWDALYEKYLTTTHCELCQVELTPGKQCKTTKCLDHCHASGAFRNVVCKSCNSSLPQQPQ